MLKPKVDGMTLVELLIVFAILGLLVSLVGPTAYKQLERTRAQEEWLTLERATRDLAFQSYLQGVNTSVEFSGTQLAWRSEGGVSRRLLFEHLFFDPSVSSVITPNGIFDRDRVTLSQRGRPRELALNAWVESGRLP